MSQVKQLSAFVSILTYGIYCLTACLSMFPNPLVNKLFDGDEDGDMMGKIFTPCIVLYRTLHEKLPPVRVESMLVGKTC